METKTSKALLDIRAEIDEIDKINIYSEFTKCIEAKTKDLTTKIFLYIDSHFYELKFWTYMYEIHLFEINKIFIQIPITKVVHFFPQKYGLRSFGKFS